MDMPLPLSIKKIKATVKLAQNRKDNLHAFGVLEIFVDSIEKPLFKVRGWTIRTKVFGEKRVLVAVPPAYPGGNKLHVSFFTNDKELWKDITKLFLDEYAELSGGSSTDDADYIDVDEVDVGIERNRNKRQKIRL